MLIAVLVTIENGLVFRSNESLYLLLLAIATLMQTFLFCLSFAFRDDTAAKVVNVGTFGLAAEVTMLWLSSSENNTQYQSWIARGAIAVGLIITYTVIMITATSGRKKTQRADEEA